MTSGRASSYVRRKARVKQAQAFHSAVLRRATGSARLRHGGLDFRIVLICGRFFSNHPTKNKFIYL